MRNAFQMDSVPNIRNARAAIKKAFENQINKKGFSIVEVLSPAPPTGDDTG